MSLSKIEWTDRTTFLGPCLHHSRIRRRQTSILVMERTLGRPLRPDELVHHGPGGKQDNRPENLSAQTRVAHAKHHDSDRGRDALGRFPPNDLRVREFPK
jgi:hypothetical protein